MRIEGEAIGDKVNTRLNEDRTLPHNIELLQVTVANANTPMKSITITRWAGYHSWDYQVSDPLRRSSSSTETCENLPCTSDLVGVPYCSMCLRFPEQLIGKMG